jgi:hypothetical protein
MCLLFVGGGGQCLGRIRDQELQNAHLATAPCHLLLCSEEGVSV